MAKCDCECGCWNTSPDIGSGDWCKACENGRHKFDRSVNDPEYDE
jgi:hypothetical protein